MIIVHVLTRFLRAGCEENTLATCRAQLDAGHQVYIIYGEEGDEELIQEQPRELTFIQVPSFVHRLSPTKDLPALFALTRHLRALGADIVHTHQSKAGILGRAAARLAKIPVVIHGVHILPFLNVSRFQEFIYVTAERAVAPFTDAYISVSRGMMDACITRKIGSPQKHHLVHSGMNLKIFQDCQPPDDWRTLAGIGEQDEKPPILLFMAALETRKRQDAFLHSVPYLVERIPNLRVLFAGDGPKRVELEQLTQELGLASNVRFLGFYPDPQKLISLADMTVLTSYREGLPRVIIQSLAGDTPVALTHLEGIEEIVTDGTNGLIAPCDDLSGLAVKIADTLTDSTLLDRLRQGARQSQMLSWDEALMTDRIDEIYKRICAEKKTPRQMGNPHFPQTEPTP